MYITKTLCFSDNVTNKIPQVNIAIGPRSIFKTWRYEWWIDKVSVISTRIKEYELFDMYKNSTRVGSDPEKLTHVRLWYVFRNQESIIWSKSLRKYVKFLIRAWAYWLCYISCNRLKVSGTYSTYFPTISIFSGILYIHEFDNNVFGNGCFKLGVFCFNCLSNLIERFISISIQILETFFSRIFFLLTKYCNA